MKHLTLSPELRLPLDVKERLRRRLMAKVRKESDGCWTWVGGKFKSGYGQMSINDKPWLTHRVSYLVFIGPIQNGLFVCHKCDVPACVNPDHLFLGDQAANMGDAASKGRISKPPVHYGLKNKMATRPDAIVAEARRLRASGVQQRDVAKRLGVSQSTVWRWAHGRTRKTK